MISHFRLFCIIGVAACQALAFAVVDEKKPNIIFIISDDQTYESVNAHGFKELKTPSLDRLATNGVTFTQAYNMGAWQGAVCVSSRTMLQTGQFLWKTKQADKNLQTIAQKEQRLWPQLLKQAGYETYMTGKWHVHVPVEDVFNHVVNLRPGMPKQTPEGYNRPIEGELDEWSPYATQFGGNWAGGKHWSEVLADDAENYINQASKKDKPFFMYLAFSAPHDPRQAPKRFVDMYPLEDVQVPASFLPEYPYKQEIDCYEIPLMKKGKVVGTKLARDESLAPWPRTEFAVRTHRQEYYAMITHMDEQIGRILDALENSGEADNTYVIFTSDHGLACGEHGLLGKQNMYEHSMRVPFIVTGPEVPAGEQRDAPIYLQDAVTTTLELAGAEIPDEVDFKSLVPAIRDASADAPYDRIYGAFKEDKQRMIRIGDYKLILYPEAGVVRLFNLKDDPDEIRDLAGDPSQWARIREMFISLQELQVEYGDKLDLSKSYPDLTLR
ncbi:sulfatase-like hydrolase/transferase [Pelagicoccus mobilis]|uniref:Sulfatase-like hydrolase/transferase n=1 Tax=Pelagicoccus mobilis TaxID=415221 RepID=A0A934RX81_9BACT|nr:sulfatase-like hydrolase/transferase [Pelagicoccus mobilis]MBK1876042.1 sulfatase-like hydrolase/transferase [Pelagicoccus mobilis]